MLATKVNLQKLYQENPNLKKKDVEIIEQWIEKQPHLPKVTELQLIIFLQSCCYQIQPTKITIDSFFTMRTLMPEIFYLPSVEEIKQNSSVGYVNLSQNFFFFNYYNKFLYNKF